MKKYTEETFHFDISHKNVQKLVTQLQEGNTLSEKDFAIKAYNYVRDTWQYYPYRVSLVDEDWKSSKIIPNKKGHCLDKAIILISILRAVNIPARLGLAKVKNHIAVDQIVEKFETDVLVPHGYVEIYLNNKWVKATPAFNKELCRILNVQVLEFNGENDSLFQEFNESGDKVFMEYLEDYGSFNEVPLPFMLELMRKYYPQVRKQNVKLGDLIDLSK